MSAIVTRCKSCTAPIRFARLASGKMLPLNVEPDALRGNVRWDPLTNEAVVLKRGEVEEARARRAELYLSHFASCPQGPAHRTPPPGLP